MKDFSGEWVNQGPFILFFHEKPASYPSPESRDQDQNVMSPQTHSQQSLVFQEEQLQGCRKNTYKINLKTTPGILFVIFSQNVYPEITILTMHIAE